jgi:hypothetical protein
LNRLEIHALLEISPPVCYTEVAENFDLEFADSRVALLSD